MDLIVLTLVFMLYNFVVISRAINVDIIFARNDSFTNKYSSPDRCQKMYRQEVAAMIDTFGEKKSIININDIFNHLNKLLLK